MLNNFALPTLNKYFTNTIFQQDGAQILFIQDFIQYLKEHINGHWIVRGS